MRCGRAFQSATWLIVALAMGSVLVESSVAQQEQPPKAQPPELRQGELNLDASRIYVHVDKTGFGHEHAVVGKLTSGEVHLGAAQKAGLLKFDMKSFVADTADARKYIGLPGETDANTKKQVTDNMLGADVLNVQKFPAATFEIDACQLLAATKPGDPPKYQLDGKFTLHGVTKPLRLTAQVEVVNGWHRLHGQFAILQTQFGITPYSKALGAVGVADKITIWGDLWIHP